MNLDDIQAKTDRLKGLYRELAKSDAGKELKAGLEDLIRENRLKASRHVEASERLGFHDRADGIQEVIDYLNSFITGS